MPDKQIPPYKELKTSNTQYVEWLCHAVAKTPKLFTSFFGLDMIEKLNNQITSPFKQGSPVTRKDLYNMCRVIGQNKINSEEARVSSDSLKNQDFIEFANVFEQGLK